MQQSAPRPNLGFPPQGRPRRRGSSAPPRARNAVEQVPQGRECQQARARRRAASMQVVGGQFAQWVCARGQREGEGRVSHALHGGWSLGAMCGREARGGWSPTTACLLPVASLRPPTPDRLHWPPTSSRLLLPACCCPPATARLLLPTYCRTPDLVLAAHYLAADRLLPAEAVERGGLAAGRAGRGRREEDEGGEEDDEDEKDQEDEEMMRMRKTRRTTRTTTRMRRGTWRSRRTSRTRRRS